MKCKKTKKIKKFLLKNGPQMWNKFKCHQLKKSWVSLGISIHLGPGWQRVAPKWSVPAPPELNSSLHTVRYIVHNTVYTAKTNCRWCLICWVRLSTMQWRCCVRNLAGGLIGPQKQSGHLLPQNIRTLFLPHVICPGHTCPASLTESCRGERVSSVRSITTGPWPWPPVVTL